MIDLALLGARLILAVVFLVAGLAKLADRAGSRQALVGFGLPGLLATPFAVLLPLAELAVAVALVPLASAWVGAIGALALLLLFVLGIGVNLALGRTPDCHCFGQLHSEPVGWPTLLRNAVLAAVAGFVVGLGAVSPGASAVAWLGALSTFEVALVAGATVGLLLVAGEAWLLLQVLRQQGRLLLQIDGLEERVSALVPAAAGTPAADGAPPVLGLPVGSPAPSFRLDGLRGETLTLEALLAHDKPLLLVFSNPGCGPCQGLLPDIGRLQRERAASLSVALISEGSVEANRNKSAEHGLVQVLLQKQREVAEAYQANGTPAAVVVRPDGTIGSPLALGGDPIRALIAQIQGPPAQLPVLNGHVPTPVPAPVPAAPPAPPSRIGQPAPALKLPDLDGKTVDLASFKGRKTLLLFWNPGCGFCQRMLEPLKSFEADPPKGAPKVVVISTGAVEDNRKLGLRSPLLLDEGFGAGSAFGANGTPMGVLLDEKGRIASEVAAGADAVFALARAPISA
jgi:peroxiredoxin